MKYLIILIVGLALGFFADSRTGLSDILVARASASTDPYNQLLAMRGGSSDATTFLGIFFAVALSIVVLVVVRLVAQEVRGALREKRLAKRKTPRRSDPLPQVQAYRPPESRPVP